MLGSKGPKKWILSLPTAQQNPPFSLLWIDESRALRTHLRLHQNGFNQVKDHADQQTAALWTQRWSPSKSMAVPQCLDIVNYKDKS